MKNKHTYRLIIGTVSISLILAGCSFFNDETQDITQQQSPSLVSEVDNSVDGAVAQPEDRKEAVPDAERTVKKAEDTHGQEIFFYQRSSVEHLSQKDPMLLRTMLAFEPFDFLLPHPFLEKEINITIGDKDLSFKAVDVFDVSNEEERNRICSKDTLSKLCPEQNGVVVEIGGAEVLLPQDDLLMADMINGQRIWISAEKIGLSNNEPSQISVTQFQPTAPKHKAISIKLADENTSDSVEESESIQKNSGMSDAQKQAKRQTDLQIISNFLLQYKITNGMQLPFEVSQGAPTAFCKHGAVDCTGLIDVRDIFYDYNSEEFPVDPSASSENSAEYFVEVGADGKATISAPNASEEMSVTK